MPGKIIDAESEFEGPVSVAKGIGLVRDPLVYENVSKGKYYPFSPEGRNPMELVHVVGYKKRTGPEYLGVFPLAELDDAIQGPHNLGYEKMMIRSMDRLGETDRVVASDINGGSLAE